MDDDAEWMELQRWRHALVDQKRRRSPVETMDHFKRRWTDRVELERAFLKRYIPPGAESNRMIQAEMNRLLSMKQREDPAIEREWFRRGLHNECLREIGQKAKRAESGAVIATVQVDFDREVMTVRCFTRLTPAQHEAMERVALRRGLGCEFERAG